MAAGRRTVKRALQDEQDRAAARLQAITRGNAERSRKGKRRRKTSAAAADAGGVLQRAGPASRSRRRLPSGALGVFCRPGERSGREDDDEPRCRPVLRMRDRPPRRMSPLVDRVKPEVDHCGVVTACG